MYTILEKNEASIIKDRSEFIGIVLHINSPDDVNRYLQEIKKEYPKAKHYCYAYIVGDKKKGFDDGEPSKTAGRPLLELLEKKNLDEVLLVIVRYFGGILLGASRLMSTYIEAGVKVLDDSLMLKIETKYVYHCNFTYKDFDTFKRLAKSFSFSLENINYDTTINVDVLADENFGEQLTNYFPQMSVEVHGKRKVYKKIYD